MSGPETCPSFCDGDHHDGGVHRGEVGAAIIDGCRFPVALLKLDNETSPSLVISGPVYVQVHPDDHDDMADLLTLCGQPVLAALIRKAAEIVKETGR